MKKSTLTLIASALLATSCAQQTPADETTEAVAQNIRTVSVSEAAALVEENKDLVVLDVRTPEEFAEGHIEGALNIDFHGDDFKTRIAALDKSKTYLFHCNSGGRSGKTEKMLKSLGFTDAAHLQAGLSGWREAELPTVTQ
ncbi:MAG: rhodanese-like domain-containing protein [Pseudomonadota bacterium]